MRVPRVMTYLACLLVLVTLSQLVWLHPADGQGDDTATKFVPAQPTLPDRTQRNLTPLPPVEPDFPDEWYRNQSTVNVVMWDGGTPWGWADGDVISTPNYAGFAIKKEKCPVECRWTQDRSNFQNSDAVLFDVCGMGPYEWHDVPIYFPPKYPGQKWMWYAYEQVHYFPMLAQKEYLDQFDGHISYRHDSYEQISYTCPWGDVHDFLRPPPPKTKERFVAFFASNCGLGGAKERTEFVRELMQYMPVDSFGGCLHNKDDPKAERGRMMRWSNGEEQRLKIDTISEYKFLLAFENSNLVDDYVTEKIINAWQAGTVPVYRGSPTIDLWVPGDKSLIDVRDFTTAKDLAEFLLRLNDNDAEYMSFFEWKKKGLKDSFKTLLSKCLFYVECRLCKHLARDRAKLQQKMIAAGSSPSALTPNHAKKWFALVFNRLDMSFARRVDDVLIVQKHPLLDLSSDFTIMAWINVNMLGDGRIVDKNSAGAFDGYLVDVLKHKGTQGRLRFCGADTCLVTKRLLNVGVWYHVAVTGQLSGSGFDLRFYVNGKADETYTVEKRLATNNLNFHIGRAATGISTWRGHHAGTAFDGIIDELSLWSRAMSLEDIYHGRWQHFSGSEEGLIAYWDFNEGEGRVAHDRSPNQLHAQFTHGCDPTWVLSVSKPLNDVTNVEDWSPPPAQIPAAG